MYMMKIWIAQLESLIMIHILFIKIELIKLINIIVILLDLKNCIRYLKDGLINKQELL